MEIIDIHSHVLPKIDDGPTDWDTCLEMLRRSAECGVSKIIATPHYYPWEQRCIIREIEALCHKAEKKLRSKYGISMDIYPGNEVYYSVDVINHLKKGEILTLAGSRYVLVEFEPKVSYQVMCRAVSDFQNSGYIPVFAHVERYRCLHNWQKMQELRQKGVLFQMNTSAFRRGIFHSDSRWARRCLRNGDIDFLASDMHDLQRRSPMAKERLNWVKKKLSPTYQKELLHDNAQKILGE